MDKVIIGLPAYNEGKALGKLFDKLKSLKESIDDLGIVVINDGSSDNTEEILENYSNKYDFISYINHDGNKGLGMAMNTLFNHVTKNFRHGDILVTLDADNTHNPNIIPKMIDKLKAESLDVVVASRFVRGGEEIGLSPIRKLYSRGARLFFKSFFPRPTVNDYSSGFRAYDIGYLKVAMVKHNNKLITSKGFESMAEIMARFSKMDVEAGEYPLVLEYNLKEDASKMRPVRTIIGYFTLLRKVQRIKE